MHPDQQPKRVFLDNNIWNRLVDGTIPFTQADLTRAFRNESLVVVGSLEQLEEIMLAADRQHSKFRRMRSLWRKLVGKRILLPMHQRHLAEVERRGVVPEPECYVPARARRSVHAISTRRRVIAVVNERVYGAKSEVYEADQDARDAILEELETLGIKRKQLSTGVNRATIDEWCRDVVSAGGERGLPTLPSDEVSRSTVPSAWLMCGATAARSVRVVRENRSVKASDNHDRHHAAAGAYYDFLVTDDKEYRETLALIPELPFEVLSVEQFAEWLRERTSST